jgi:hypothetical protein
MRLKRSWRPSREYQNGTGDFLVGKIDWIFPQKLLNFSAMPKMVLKIIEAYKFSVGF